MPRNKNFQKRITILDECFSSRTGFFTLERLIHIVEEKLGGTVSRKTIQNDIKYIRETIEETNSDVFDFSEYPIFVPKLIDNKKKVFRYSNPDLSLGSQLLSKSDRQQLEETLAILSRYKNRQEFYWLDELFPRIKASFNIVHEDYNGLISYQNNRHYSGQSWLGTLYNQLIRKKVLIIEYKRFNDENSYSRKIHPYHLKQYNNRWFLFGYEESESYTGITNLPLDRICKIKETVDDIRPDTISWGDYFDEMIGVSTTNEAAVEVKLKFSEKMIPYVLTKPIHGTNQERDKSDPEGRTITIKVLPNLELYQTILSFGDDVKVLSPKLVIKKMKEISQSLNNFYN